MSEAKTQRELPPSQQKMDSDIDEDDDLSMQTMERANELSRQYESIKDRTVDDNTVLGKIEDIDTSHNNNRIIIHVDVPAQGSNKMFRFKKPKLWSRDYEFVRWIQHYNYDADSFPNMLQDSCKVKVTKDGDGSYDLYIPEKNPYLRKFTSPSFDIPKLHEWHRDIDFYFCHPLLIMWGLSAIAMMSGLIPTVLPGKQLLGLYIISLVNFIVFGIIEEKNKYEYGNQI